MDFLARADRFHGAHWINANDGDFCTKDNGGDEETHFFVKDFCSREYFKNGNTAEKALANKADQLWRCRVELVYWGRDTLLALVSNYN
jgi:hypothetical protein